MRAQRLRDAGVFVSPLICLISTLTEKFVLQEDLLIHGDSAYDLLDRQDHAGVQTELLRSGDDERLFLCRMNVSRNARRQMRFGDQKVRWDAMLRVCPHLLLECPIDNLDQCPKVVLVQGHYLSFVPLCARNEPVFLATCTPVAMPETRECVVQGATNVFTTIHAMDMTFLHVDKKFKKKSGRNGLPTRPSGEFHLGFCRSELQSVSWYHLLHWDCMREAQSKHRLTRQQGSGPVLRSNRLQQCTIGKASRRRSAMRSGAQAQGARGARGVCGAPARGRWAPGAGWPGPWLPVAWQPRNPHRFAVEGGGAKEASRSHWKPAIHGVPRDWANTSKSLHTEVANDWISVANHVPLGKCLTRAESHPFEIEISKTGNKRKPPCFTHMYPRCSYCACAEPNCCIWRAYLQGPRMPVWPAARGTYSRYCTAHLARVRRRIAGGAGVARLGVLAPACPLSNVFNSPLPPPTHTHIHENIRAIFEID
ncbi:dysfusion-like [Frankliniella occidentalis]|nr:dysfusion-like [Frankliniella occidentalis]